MKIGSDEWKLANPPRYDEESKTYLLEVYGEVEIDAYSEEEAEEALIERIQDYIREGIIQIN